jgi:Predicted nucleic acid-binding protein, contains PIN domain
MSDLDVLVVDASVLAAVAFGEARADEGVALLRGSRLVAPGLLWYEMSEVARTKCLARSDEAEAILEQLEAARRLPINLRSPDWETITQLALDTGLTAYDAAYLSLAQSLRAPLATFDRRLGDVAGRVMSALMAPDDDVGGLGTRLHERFVEADTFDLDLPARSAPRAAPDFSDPRG